MLITDKTRGQLAFHLLKCDCKTTLTTAASLIQQNSRIENYMIIA